MIEENEREATANLKRELEELQGDNVKGMWSAMISGGTQNHSELSSGSCDDERYLSNTSGASRETHLTQPGARHPFAVSKKVNLCAAVAGRKGSLPKRMLTLSRTKYTSGSILKKTVHKTRAYSRKPFSTLVKRNARKILKKKIGIRDISAPITVKPLHSSGFFGPPQLALPPLLPSFPSCDPSQAMLGIPSSAL